MKTRYDVVVVGSGYGGSIAACRIASAGQSVCVLERGKEWLPGEFPETFLHALGELQVHLDGKNDEIGRIICFKIEHIVLSFTICQKQLFKASANGCGRESYLNNHNFSNKTLIKEMGT